MFFIDGEPLFRNEFNSLCFSVSKQSEIVFCGVCLNVGLWVSFDWYEIRIQQCFGDQLIELNQGRYDEFGKLYEIPSMI